MSVTVPHLAMPFRVGPDNAVVTVEQDSSDEVIQSVALLLLTREGERLSVPDYGVPDITFRTIVPLTVLHTEILRWEPRASVIINEHPGLLDEQVRNVGIVVSEA